MLTDRFLTNVVCNNKFHDGMYKIFYKTHNEEGHKEIKISIDHTTCSAMKLTVTDENDPRFMFSLELTREDYSTLQTQQSLLVQFEAFPKQVVRLLEQCGRGDMLLQLLQTAQSEWCLQFVERNEFKRSVYLQLLIGRASDGDLIKFMSNKVQTLTESLNKAHQTLMSKEDTYRRAIDQRDADIQNLKKSLDSTKLEIKRTETEYKRELASSIEHISKERDMWQREQDNRYESKLNDLQLEIQRKKSDVDRIKSELSVKSDKIYSLENSLRDHLSKIKSLEHDLNASRLEHGTLQNELSRVQRDCNDRDGQIQNLRTRVSDLERRLVIKDEQLNKANTSLTLCQQNIAEAESKVTDCMIKLNNKRESLQLTNQDLTKANEIIARQNEQMTSLKEKVKFRTAVAFEQEKIIEKIQMEVSNVKAENNDMKNRLEETSSKCDDYSKELSELKTKLAEKDKTIEYNTTMINWMQKRINETSGIDNYTGNQNITSGVGSMTLKNDYNTMIPTYQPRSMPFGFPFKKNARLRHSENITNKNEGDLNPDLLLPDDTERSLIDTERTGPPRTLGLLSNNIPRCSALPGTSKPNTERSLKTMTSAGSDNNKAKFKTRPRIPPTKNISTPSAYFKNLT